MLQCIDLLQVFFNIDFHRVFAAVDKNFNWQRALWDPSEMAEFLAFNWSCLHHYCNWAMSRKRKGLQFRGRFLQAGCRSCHPTHCINAPSISAFSRNIRWWLVVDWLADDAGVETCGVVRCWRGPVSRRSVGLAGETLRMSHCCRRLPRHARCIAAMPASQLNWVTLTQCRRLYQVSCCFFDSDHMHCQTVTLE